MKKLLILSLLAQSALAQDFTGTVKGNVMAIATETTFSMVQMLGPLKLFHNGMAKADTAIEEFYIKANEISYQIDKNESQIEELERLTDDINRGYYPFIENADEYRDLSFKDTNDRKVIPNAKMEGKKLKATGMANYAECYTFYRMKKSPLLNVEGRLGLRYKFKLKSEDALLERVVTTCEENYLKHMQKINSLKDEIKLKNAELITLRKEYGNIYEFGRRYGDSVYFERTEWFNKLGSAKGDVNFRSLNLSGDKLIVDIKLTNPLFSKLNFESTPTITLSAEAQLESCNNKPISASTRNASNLKGAIENLRAQKMNDFFICDLSLNLIGYAPVSQNYKSHERYDVKLNNMKLQLTNRGDLIIKNNRLEGASGDQNRLYVTAAQAYGFQDTSVGYNYVPESYAPNALIMILDEQFFKSDMDGINHAEKRLPLSYQWQFKSSKKEDQEGASERINERLSRFNEIVQDYSLILLQIKNEELSASDGQRVVQAAISKFKKDLVNVLNDIDADFPNLSVLTKISAQQNIRDVYYNIRAVNQFVSTMSQFRGIELIDVTVLKFTK